MNRISSKSAFLNKVSNNPVFNSAWKAFPTNRINAKDTLPIEIPTKDEIFKSVDSENYKKLKQWAKYGKTIIKFYKTGITNVFGNYKLVKQLKNEYKITSVDTHGNDLSLKLPKFSKLVEIMSQQVYMDKIQKNSKSKVDTVIKKNTDQLFSLQRDQFQVLKRIPPNLTKIPLFVLICLVFGEFTPLICYMLPKIAPSTCILPNLLPKIYSQSTSIEEIEFKTAFNLDSSNLRKICSSLNLVSFPRLYPEVYLRNLLQNYHNYLKVDNFYLSGMNSSGNLWNLNDQELVYACLERNLIKNEEITKIQDISITTLKNRLFIHLIEFPEYGIGYLMKQKSYEVDVTNWR